MRDRANESSGDGSEDGNPVLVARRKQGEVRRAEMGASEPAAWLTGYLPDRRRRARASARLLIARRQPGMLGHAHVLAYGVICECGMHVREIDEL